MDSVSCLAKLIITQHYDLKNLDNKYISDFVEGKTHAKVLLLLDGYDEYTPGTNKDIDHAISHGIGKCFVILTTRPGFLEKQDIDRFDKHLYIEGFSEENIKLCSSNYLQSKKKSNELLKQARDIGINDLLNIPIVLLMTCVVYDEKKMLPKSKTELLRTIFELSMDRSTLKIFKKKSSELNDIGSLLNTLGEFSWQSLQNDVQQLLINKVVSIL